MSIEDRIKKDITDNRIMVYMKGSPSFPQCGFSKAVVDILANFDHDFNYANVLEDPELRQGIKEYFDWPTIPQIIVDGEFIGGCDIMVELYQSGELGAVLAGE